MSPDLEKRYRCRDGAYRRPRWNVVLHRNPRSRYGVARDVTEEVPADQQVTENILDHDHQLRLESLARLTGGAAHHFDNLLGIILGHTSLLASSIGPGLSAVYGIITQNGGRVAVSTEKNVGATISLWFPPTGEWDSAPWEDPPTRDRRSRDPR
ncbi:MAG: hypothetical protein HY815_12000 [Candidatus Riflebacteria bacterium]|nr:hypothetical protein [Candidatus Riflebacteria bacterium]